MPPLLCLWCALRGRWHFIVNLRLCFNSWAVQYNEDSISTRVWLYLSSRKYWVLDHTCRASKRRSSCPYRSVERATLQGGGRRASPARFWDCPCAGCHPSFIPSFLLSFLYYFLPSLLDSFLPNQKARWPLVCVVFFVGFCRHFASGWLLAFARTVNFCLALAFWLLACVKSKKKKNKKVHRSPSMLRWVPHGSWHGSRPSARLEPRWHGQQIPMNSWVRVGMWKTQV